MAENLSGGSVQYVKWGTEEGQTPPGSVVKGTLESITWDAPGQFGPESFVRLMDDEGSTLQVRISAGLKGTFQNNQSRMVPGQTVIAIAYEGIKPNPKPGGKPFHSFKVTAEGLKAKGSKAEAPAAKPAAKVEASPAGLPVKDGGDLDSFDPKSLS